MTAVLDTPSVLDADPDTRSARRLAARSTLGISGDDHAPPLRPVLR
ncbi:MAG: hypothetical protein JWO27_460 [Frankiales bacterium]|nr:hypothetical protein [Frankiales bacterium]